MRSRLSNLVLKIVSKISVWFGVNIVALITLIIIHFGTNIQAYKWWADCFALLSNLFIGGIISFLFYFLVVYIPDRKRLKIMRRNLIKMYLDIKRDILYSVVIASVKGGRSDLTTSAEAVEELMQTKKFREMLSGGKLENEGFYAFENQMSHRTPEFENITQNLKLLSRQIEFFLNNYPLFDQDLFDFLKRLEIILIKVQHSGAGYDESKPLCSFICEMFAGFSPATGYYDFDAIEKIIKSL